MNTIEHIKRAIKQTFEMAKAITNNDNLKLVSCHGGCWKDCPEWDRFFNNSYYCQNFCMIDKTTGLGYSVSFSPIITGELFYSVTVTDPQFDEGADEVRIH